MTLEAKIDARVVEKTQLMRALEVMWLSRKTDAKMLKLVKQNKGATFQLSAAGHEMIGAVCSEHLRPGVDWACPYYRDQPLAIGLGTCLVENFGVFLGRKTKNHSAGRMMPYHYSHKELRMPTQSSAVGSQYLPAAGLAQGIKGQGLDEVVYVSGGDGSTSEGDFHEALNYAGLHKLPVIFVVHDNGWAISVPVDEQVAGGSIQRAFKNRVGVETHGVDGCDYEELSSAMAKSMARARAGEGPSLIVARVPRMGSHSNSDDPRKYKTDEMLANDAATDPIKKFEAYLLKGNFCTEGELEAFRQEIHERIEEAAHEAEHIPFPKPEEAADHVFISWEPTGGHQVAPETGEKVVMVDAINHALVEEMERDPGVVVFGEDVARGKGGVFGVTRGLTDQFGADRCFNTPLAEATIIGAALGLSLDGYHKPVAEIQFADYIWPGFDQVASEVSSICYRSAGHFNAPLVLRLPSGGYIQGGPYHSQSIEAILAHFPGIKVAYPSNAADAKGLMKAAIRDPNPVLFLEHKALYRQAKYCARVEPDRDYVIPFGKAAIAREGSDLTVVGWGITVVMAMDVAQKLAQEGIEIEVIDLRTIVPADIATIVTSVKKTGKLLIAHEAARNSGFGGEIAAQVAEEAFEYLDGPITRVCGLDAPVAYTKPLENGVLPQTEDLEAGVRELYAY
jgi:2-oxoisovalerate dehydrogenase E1 component